MAGHYQLGFSTLEHEITLDQLPITGTVPQWLAGTLLRNGPGKFEVGQQTYRHWFDGLALLHRFSFENGKVSYANRFLQSQGYTKAMQTGKISYNEFATDPCRSIFKRMASLFSPELSNNANVNISKINDRFVAMTETPLPIEFDPQTLQTVGVFNYEDQLSGQLTTAHPHYDFVRRMGINSITQFARTSTYNVYAVNAGEKGRTLIGSVPVKEPSYMHSFGMTEHYVILAEFPLVVNPLRLMISGKPFIENFQWKPERGTRFLVMSKQDGKVVGTSRSDAFFAFHHINAFEKDGEVVVDIAAYPDTSVIDELYLERVKGLDGGTLSFAEFRRYHIPLHGSTAEYELLSEECIELPRMNYQRSNTHDYRVAYGVSTRKQHPHDFFNQLVKVDVCARTSKVWFEETCYPGEPVFVAAPDATGEDDGVVLSIVLDAQKGNSFLLILNARSFEEIGRAEVPHHIPFGFHGMFSAHSH